ncbi:MAG: hypothetical protein J0H45_07795 [Stenotrophomonas nitritireducens]|uniref:Uncharacterized protein n=1 Tax=Stenotrophomonas nitritireducens TaxID=83617 RepID=A0A9D8Q034_9GAMM|nr:hypothetical protein [Stenotrophomonas nitritireducens]
MRKVYTGRTNRSTFFCTHCQKNYSPGQEPAR